MVHDPELLDRLERRGFEAFDGEVWRQMFNNLDPARVNTRGARWNPPGVAAIYASLQPETAIAEADYTIAAQPLRPHVTRQLHRIRLSLVSTIDLSDPAILAEVGVGADQLRSVDHQACRAVGGAAHWLGADGLLVPSARNSGSNVVIFVNRMDIDAPFEVLDTRDLPEVTGSSDDAH